MHPPQQPGPYGQQPNPYGQQPGYGPQPGEPYNPYAGGYGQQPPQQPSYGPGMYPGGFTPPPRKKKTGLIVGIVIAVVVLLGGGTGLYFGVIRDSGGGSKHDSGSLASGKGKSGGKNGKIDFSTTDPCGFVTIDTFAGIAQKDPRTNKPRVDIQPDSLTNCHIISSMPQDKGGIILDIDSNTTIDLEQLKNAPESQVTKSVKGSVTTLRQKNTQNVSECHQLAYLQDGSAVQVTARPSMGAADQTGKALPGVDVCGAADKATDAVAAAMGGNKIKQLNYPQDSLGSIDTCTLLSGSDVDGILGTSGAAAVPGASKRFCDWKNKSDQHSAAIIIETKLEKQPPNPSNYAGSQQSTIAGHNTLIYSLDSPGTPEATCTGDTLGKTWNPWPGYLNVLTEAGQQPSNSLIELEHIFVLMPNSDKSKACQAVQAIAAKAWPHLPAGS